MSTRSKHHITTALNIRHLGIQSYPATVKKMQQFTANRTTETQDELWVLQHESVYTLGFNAKEENIIRDINIPIVRTDRGGQVTYHGLGQLVIYFLIDLKRRNIGIRNLVRLIENSIISLLKDYNITAHGNVDAPGVYIDNKKIAALGLRVKQQGSYHGVAFNIDMDLSPYQNINPCGVKNAEITQLSAFCTTLDFNLVTQQLIEHILQLFNNQ